MLGMATMMGSFAMSSLVDNIVLLNWVELGDAFRLGMNVAKMRANPVSRITRECEITSEGMHILLPFGASPFSRYSGLVSRAPERRLHPHPSQVSKGPANE
jgi:KaiC/GvpD/RAD55 family RecA-like ATPase